MYAIQDELTAWSFDRAVQTFGGSLENRLHQISEDAKNRKVAKQKIQRELDKWLSSADAKVAQGRFRDPLSS